MIPILPSLLVRIRDQRDGHQYSKSTCGLLAISVAGIVASGQLRWWSKTTSNMHVNCTRWQHQSLGSKLFYHSKSGTLLRNQITPPSSKLQASKFFNWGSITSFYGLVQVSKEFPLPLVIIKDWYRAEHLVVQLLASALPIYQLSICELYPW